MYHHLKQKIVTLLTALCLTVGTGVGTAAAAEPAAGEPTLLEIAARVAQYSKCRERPLLERPRCHKEFALKSIKLGLGVGAFIYLLGDPEEGGGTSFDALNKELEQLVKLRPLLTPDPKQQADPEKRRQALQQALKTFKAAKPHLDNLGTNLVTISRLVGAENESAEVLAMLVAANYVPPGEDLPPVVIDGDPIGKWFDELNAALGQAVAGMNTSIEALDEMNAALDGVNQTLGEMNQALEGAARGMDKANQGVAEMNAGMSQVNKAVTGFNKAADGLLKVSDIKFDFSHVGEAVGTTGTTPEENAARDARMGALLNVLPGVGDGKGIVEAITGKDMATGGELSTADRALGALAVLRWLKVGGKLIPDDIRKVQRRMKCDSFPAGTQVLMADGSTKPIEAVQVGDEVLAADPSSGTTGARRVDDTIRTPDDRDFTGITLDAALGGGSLTATDHHPFWTQNSGKWTHAADLNAGDALRTPDGSTARIQQVTHWKTLQPAYNLTVNDLHSYHVLAGKTPVLVHNASCSIIPGEIPDAVAIDRGSLVKLKEKQLEKALQSMGEDPHGFKADWVGKNMVSRFDAMRDGDNRIVLVSKDGRILVPTNYRYRP
ncbi:polymorphic toxin-type HINT domain-containing protein [Streptomyces sp. NPDC096136]|uniref:polymorphic toxin-type HINT domain-containing protein n=1 Tax=Streptomyces sp. NPDC096136 TaxID=3366076 RepID=UPI0037F73AD8